MAHKCYTSLSCAKHGQKLILCVLCLVAKDEGNNTYAVFIHRGIVEGEFLRGSYDTLRNEQEARCVD